MGLFFKKSSSGENRIENSGRWPVRLTRFRLVDEYEFPATNFPEIFFVEEGTFLHESEAGTQAVREGATLMVNAGIRHSVKQPGEVVLTRVRYLPEWLTREYEIVIRSPDLLALFFDQSWIRFPRDENLHVFTTRGEGASRIRAELEYLRGLLRDQRQLEPVTRVSMLKLMLLLADEHRHFWRGVSDLEILPAAAHALDQIESTILRAQPFDPETMSRGGFEKRAIEKTFAELTGMGMSDYAHRRRVFHAAYLLLTTHEEPRRISKALGWTTTAEFAKHFDSVFGITPSVYREKFGMPRKEEPGSAEAGAGEGE